jgi:hypothetical protein
VCLHAPLRARSVLESKADAGRPLEEVEEYLGPAWHVKRWRTLAQEHALDLEWVANSYANDGLDVYGVRHELVIDTTLRDVVRRWIGPDVAESQTPDGSSQPAMFRPARVPDGNQQRLVQPGPSQMSEMGSGPEGPDPPSSELRRARQRLARQERGIALLREYFQGEVNRRDTQVSERDRQIRELQEKRDALLAKGDRVRQQLAKRDQRIGELQAEAAALREIQQSKAWRLVNAWWTLRRKLWWPMLRREE